MTLLLTERVQVGDCSPWPETPISSNLSPLKGNEGP